MQIRCVSSTNFYVGVPRGNVRSAAINSRLSLRSLLVNPRSDFNTCRLSDKEPYNRLASTFDKK